MRSNCSKINHFEETGLQQALGTDPRASSASPLGVNYLYNAANQRVRATDADGSHWVYEYDALGQVKGGRKFWADGTPVAGQQFTYVHDDICPVREEALAAP